MYWRLNKIQFPVYNLGPGKRLAIWTQGCATRCKGCINPETWSEEGGSSIHPAIVASHLAELQDQFDGITITGGEPFDQYEALMAFCAFIKSHSDLDIFVYSGYRLDELVVRFPDKLFLEKIDYLMDGPFKLDLATDDSTRGSSNQKLYTFEGANIRCITGFNTFNLWSVNYTGGNKVFMAGIPKPGDLSKLSGMLQKAGIKIDF